MKIVLALSSFLALSLSASPSFAKQPSKHQSKLHGTARATKVSTALASVDDAAEQAIVEQVNAERAALGLSPVVVDPRLREAARVHSRDMAELNFFSHDSPVKGRSGFTDRIREQGLSKFGAAGENIAMAHYGPSQRAAGFMDLWMNSEGHRANILTEEYNFIGVGVYVAADGRVYASQEFSSLGSTKAKASNPLALAPQQSAPLVEEAPVLPVEPEELAPFVEEEPGEIEIVPEEEAFFPEEEREAAPHAAPPSRAPRRDLEAEKRRIYGILEERSRNQDNVSPGFTIIVVPVQPQVRAKRYYYTTTPRNSHRSCR
jgi:uncharacterized protein YkwD